MQSTFKTTLNIKQQWSYNMERPCVMGLFTWKYEGSGLKRKKGVHKGGIFLGE